MSTGISCEANASDQDGGDDAQGFLHAGSSPGVVDESLLTVVKSEGTPFVVNTPVVVAPEIDSMYKR